MAEQYLKLLAKDFVQIFGTPIHPEFIAGYLNRPFVFSAHWSAKSNGEYWMIYDTLRRGSYESMARLANDLRNDETIKKALQDPRFAVGPTFTYSDRTKCMVPVRDDQMGCSVYINRLPSFDPKNVERVHNLYI
jgi:hypothetical protein